MNIYCGNNELHPDLVSGEKIPGTRSECLQKGRRIGFSQAVDPKYSGDYRPLHEYPKIWCDETNPTPGDHILGNLPMCLQRGIGQAKAIKARGGFKDMIKNLSLGKIVISILILGIIVLVGLVKPKFVCYKDEHNNYQFDTTKFILFCVIIISLFLIILVHT